MSTCTHKRCKKKVLAKGLCNTHYSDYWAKKNPVKYAFFNLKKSAKRRGKEFTITYEDFEKWATEVDLIKKHGKTAISYHIDRIDNSKGYTPDNIQLLTNSDNVKKEHQIRRQKKIVWHFGGLFSTQVTPPPTLFNDENLPF